MSIEYHNLSPAQFEELVIEFCVELLGHGVQGFVTGKDGGRDAHFDGKANLLPSSQAPWEGKIVVQAKHTELLNKSFSESDFRGSDSTISKECKRICKLLKAKELDYYLLFANRRLTGVEEPKIRKTISDSTGLAQDCIRLYDSSELDRLCKRHPDAVTRADLNPGRAPMDFDPLDLANVITKLADYKSVLNELLEGDTLPPAQRISAKEKNASNGLKEAYFKKAIRPRMVDFPSIQQFLSHPDNQPFVKLYEDVADELEGKLTAYNADDVEYERLLETMITRLFSRDFDLRQHRRLTRAVVFYMYCHCDIGNPTDD